METTDPTRDLVRRAIAQAGSQRNLSSAVGVSQSSLSRWRAGDRRPTARAYRALLKYLGCSLAEVDKMTGEWLDSNQQEEET